MGMVMVCGLILWHQSLRNRTYLTISALSSPEQSPWNHLWRNGDDNSFANLTGFSRNAFHELHYVVFGRLVDEQEPRKRGRPQKLNSVAKLGLILHFLNSTMKMKTLCQLFGASPAVTSRTVNDMLWLVENRLRSNPKAAVK